MENNGFCSIPWLFSLKNSKSKSTFFDLQLQRCSNQRKYKERKIYTVFSLFQTWMESNWSPSTFIMTDLSTNICLNTARQRGNKPLTLLEIIKRGTGHGCAAGYCDFAIFPHQLSSTGVRKQRMLRKVPPIVFSGVM